LEKEGKHDFFFRIALPLLLIGLMVWLKLFEVKSGASFSEFGIYPRSVKGLKGLFFSQFLHGDWEHLLYNSVPFFLGTWALFFFYPKSGSRVIFFSFFIPGILVWLFARSSYHIGLSGVNYSILAFLFIGGFIRRDRKRLPISLLIVLFYGGLIVGLFPVQSGVSYESHLAGSFIGILLALFLRKWDPNEKFSWELDNEETEKRITGDDTINL
jgi:membrane associated rhomboid family serine protease